MNLHNAFYKTQCALTSCGVTQGACSSLECNFLQLAAWFPRKELPFPVSARQECALQSGLPSHASAAA